MGADIHVYIEQKVTTKVNQLKKEWISIDEWEYDPAADVKMVPCKKRYWTKGGRDERDRI
ncbi:hypothetical protein [Paenibacillus sp. 2TAB19]|uniref:hypothetical protein n=1 Tax=Paenibacillus sp. 2TAB19 TaxID=3233003 RepID=UPI003F9A7338